MADKKFSDFANGEEVKVGDQIVGLRTSLNYRFDFPGDGFKDSSGNYMVGYATAGAASVNYPKLTNSVASTGVIYGADGSDANIKIRLVPKGSAAVEIDGLNFPTADGTANSIMYTDGAGNLGFTTATFPIAAGAAGTFVRSDGTNWTVSTAMLANTYAANAILYAGSVNSVSGLSGGAGDILCTNSTNVPTWLVNPSATGKLLSSVNGDTPAWTTATFPTGSGTINHLLRSDGTNWVQTTAATLDASDVMAGLTSLSVDNITINGNTFAATDTNGNIEIVPHGTGNVDIFAPPAVESGSVTVNGVAFDLAFRVNAIGVASPAEMILHRHSTVIEPVFLAVRSNSDTDAHASVTNNMPLHSHYAGGWTGAQYSLFGQIRFSADATGTINNTSAPGKLEFMVSPDGSITPATALTISNDKTVTFAGDIAAGLTDGQLLIGDTGGPFVASTLTAGLGINITNGAGSITISSSGGGFEWTEVVGTSQNMSVDNGYIANNAGLVTLTLPATASVGDTLMVQGKGAGGWRVAQNAGQMIHFNSSTTTTGVAGYIEYTQRYNSVQLICITADTEWAVIFANGVLTVA